MASQSTAFYRNIQALRARCTPPWGQRNGCLPGHSGWSGRIGGLSGEVGDTKEGKELDRPFGTAGSMEGFWVPLRDLVTRAEVGSLLLWTYS